MTPKPKFKYGSKDVKNSVNVEKNKEKNVYTICVHRYRYFVLFINT